MSTPAALDRFFGITARGSTLATELRGGAVTFVAMSYIVVLNPLILGGKPDVLGHSLHIDQVAAVTAFVAGVMCVLFGLVANYPFAFATGLGINALLATSVVVKVSWPEAMGLVVIEGLLIVLLGATGLRTAVFHAIPPELRAAITAGIGCFITLIGLVDAGFVRRVPDSAQTSVPVGLGIGGSIASLPTLIFAVGLGLMAVLVTRKVRGAIAIAIAVMTLVSLLAQAVAKLGPGPKGWGLTVPAPPKAAFSVPDLSLLGQCSVLGVFHHMSVLAAVLLVFTLLLANFFDAMGTMAGLGKQAGLMRPDGTLPNLGRALTAEGFGAVAGGLGSSSSNTVFVESATGIGEGARTGLANIVTGSLFLLAMFLTPLYKVVPVEAATPALVVVGAMMIGNVREIDFTKFEVALPAFLTIVTMPFTYSIADGIGVGCIAWVLTRAGAGKLREVHPLLMVVAVAFLVNFAAGPIQQLLAL
ncbi:Xanthine/uracil/vitamin C permease [Segniliparus rotundus DSM 44985]|uniref:Xanthine/uracil/vitamin C permease n=1 Tax=Segniliparus rotundus (strain ATCC BAA-972 / CDC 1076 / CIP 108378 / DSM 44985 / JCM 13578) TaxID=640132 RepID=D6ZDM2_SEGRD|nr:NCS2 family permease [Segniliparus rotundus]ADG99279.1 Xanthine/uracil/vitamin C permease [Segniliparus rotundus DSM 44985]